MFKATSSTLLAFLFLLGCAKEKSFDTLYKEVELMKKSDIKTHESIQTLDGKSVNTPIKYLYVPMTLGTPREVVVASPFYQGDEKVVRLDWSKDGLEVLEIEKDERFNDNELNDVPVLTIPGVFSSYQCAKDDFNDCTNKEEENTEISWEKKDFFTPDYAALKVKELNMLDLANVEGSSCVSLQGTKLVDYEVSSGVINIELEKSYKLNNSWECIRSNYYNDKLSYNSFKVRFFYSLVELSQLATPNYKSVDYPVSDHSKFGFFTNKKNNLNDNYDSQRKDSNILLNRWTPEREDKTLVYYLSKNFSKPKNKLLLDATHESIHVINKGLAKANSPFKIKLKMQKMNEKEVSPGDLRYNTLVLIEDPLANGLLGYGPSVTNPYTGEIVQAHVNMYGGVLKSIVRRVYNAAADLSAERVKKTPGELEGILVSSDAFSSLPGAIANISGTIGSQTNTTASERKKIQETFVSAVATEQLSSEDVERFKELEKNQIKEQLDQRALVMRQLDRKHDDLDELQKLTLAAEEGYTKGKTLPGEHSPEFFPIGGTTKVIYPELIEMDGIKNADGTLKSWDELRPKQKKKVFNIVLVKSWKATLIHEFGHNLGLRHNFAGSTDKENFYTLAEAKELGMEGQPAYSSIMDYSYSKFNQLKALGKYDIAALRFAYAREVELNTGEILKLNGSLSVLEDSIRASDANEKIRKQNEALPAGNKLSLIERKQYRFCTDGNAGLSSMCNRFDEGTTIEEITKFRINHYEGMYKYRNFRDGKVNFSSYMIGSYIGARNREFGKIRDVLEEYEMYTGFYGKEFMTNGCSLSEENSPREDIKKACRAIRSHINAITLVGDFFVDILKTPDHICALAKSDKPNVIVEYRKLETLYKSVARRVKGVTTTCFNAEIEKYLKEKSLFVVGENGKFLNGFKGNNPSYIYSTDRAVLGTWSDKVLAIKALFSRTAENGRTDDNHMALVDIPEIKAKLMNVIYHYTLAEPLADPLPFTTKDGAKFVVPYSIGAEYRINQLENVFGGFKQYLGMDPVGESSLLKILLKQIEKIGVKYGEKESDTAFSSANLSAIIGYPYFLGDAENERRVSFYNGSIVYSANESTPLAHYMLSAIIEKKTLDTLDKDLLKAVIKRKTNPDAPEEYTAAHKLFFVQNISLQELLETASRNDRKIEEKVFVDNFGAENGALLFEVFNEGFLVMKSIMETKRDMMTTPANDEQKGVFKYSVVLLSKYLQGALSDEVIEFYKSQLKRLPNYQKEGDL